MNKYLAILLSIFMVFIPTVSLADNDKPKIVAIQKGDTAPFTGALLNPAAEARIIADKRAIENSCKLQISYIKDRKNAECDLKVKSAQISLKFSQKRLEEIIKIKDDELAKTRQIALKNDGGNNVWWAAGGVITGVIVTIGLFFVVNQARKVD